VPVAEHTITIDHLPVYYRQAPATGVSPLYLHGVPTSSDDFAPFLERAGGIAPDLIGFGRSAKAGHLDYSIEGHADFIERLLAFLGVDRVKLVAHDWGAGGGLVFAQRHPEQVERIVLVNALPLLPQFRWSRPARLWRMPLIGELAMGSTTRWLLARTLRRGSVRKDAWSRDSVDRIWGQFDQGTQRAILRLHRGVEVDGLAQAGQGLTSLRTPALVLWGDKDPWLSSELADVYAGHLPAAQLEHYPDAGHWPWLDRPDVVERVAGFLGA
jgi:pimeloyl-ACP methyl ester carboxylesterase